MEISQYASTFFLFSTLCEKGASPGRASSIEI